jgi:uncharacterized membrane protein
VQVIFSPLLDCISNPAPFVIGTAVAEAIILFAATVTFTPTSTFCVVKLALSVAEFNVPTVLLESVGLVPPKRV